MQSWNLRKWLLLENVITQRKIETRWLLLFGFQTVLVESIGIVYFLVRFFDKNTHVSIVWKHNLKACPSSSMLWVEHRTFWWCKIISGALCVSWLMGWRILRWKFPKWSWDVSSGLIFPVLSDLKGSSMSEEGTSCPSGPSEGLVSLDCI